MVNKKNSGTVTLQNENNMDDKIKEMIELSILYDFYGELFNDHNKTVFADYILHDLSLGEIAEEKGISRQGVYDIVRRTSKKLREYEDKLHLVKKFESTKSKINRMKELMEVVKIQLEKSNDEVSSSISSLDEMIELVEDILQE